MRLDQVSSRTLALFAAAVAYGVSLRVVSWVGQAMDVRADESGQCRESRIADGAHDQRMWRTGDAAGSRAAAARLGDRIVDTLGNVLRQRIAVTLLGAVEHGRLLHFA